MGKKPAKAGTKRSKKQQRSSLEDSDEDSDVPVRGRTAYEGERDGRIAENERVLGALVARPLPMVEELQAAKSSRKRCEPKRLHARSMLSTLLRRCRKVAPARPSQTQQPRALRTRVQAPLAGQGLLTDSADSPAVYAVPRSYWLEDVSCEGAATVHCSVNGTKLIGIYVGEDAGDVELDFGSATKMFPARTAGQWRVQDLQAAQEHLSAYEAARQASSTARRPSPPRESASRSTTVAVSLGSATTRQDEVRDTHGSNPRRVRGRARSVAVPTRDVKIVRPPLAICLPTPVTAPAFVTGQPKKWVEDHKVLIRAWTRASLAGVGLRRNVPSGGAAIPDVELRDALLAPTDGLVAELMEALVTTYGARSERGARRVRSDHASVPQVPRVPGGATTLPRAEEGTSARYLRDALVDVGRCAAFGAAVARRAATIERAVHDASASLRRQDHSGRVRLGCASSPAMRCRAPRRAHEPRYGQLDTCHLANTDMRERVYVRLQAGHSIASWFSGEVRRRRCIRAWRL